METTLATGCCVPAGSGSASATLFLGLAALVVVVIVMARWFERRHADRLTRWPVGNLAEHADRAGGKKEP